MKPPVNGVPVERVLGSVHHRCLTYPSVLVLSAACPQRLTCPRQRLFFSRLRTQGPVSGQLSSGGGLEVPPWRRWFPVDFRPPAPGFSLGAGDTIIGVTGIRFLGILFPAENSAFLTVGLPARP